MPTDDKTNLVEFTDVLSAVSAVILVDSISLDYVYVLRDFNARPYKSFYNEFMNFCTDQQWS